MGILTTHLLVSIETGSLHGKMKTACGKVGIPNGADRSFKPGVNYYEGRRPASAGCGIVAVREIEFGVPKGPSVVYCERCMKKWREGAGI